MAEWTDHPQKFKGRLMMHRPAPVKSAQVTEDPPYAVLPAILWDNETGEDFGDYGTSIQWHKYSVISFGGVRGGREKGQLLWGRARDTAIDDCQVSFAGHGIRLGEINYLDDDFVTWWDQYMPYFLPTRYYETGGDVKYYKKGGIHLSALTPVANVGLPFFDYVGSNGYADIDFSAANSWTPDRMQSIYDSNFAGDQSGTGSLTASTTNGGNVVGNVADGNVATYWEATGNTDEWIKWQNPNYPTQGICGFSLTVQSTTYGPATIEVQVSNDDVTYETLSWEYMTAYTASTEYYFGFDSDTPYQYFKFLFPTTLGAGTTRVYELGIFKTSNTTITNAWEPKDGAYQAGSSSADDVTLRYYPGFRWLVGTVLPDATAFQYGGHAKRPICTLDTNRWFPSKGGCTYDESDYDTIYVGSRAFDGDHDTYWRTSGGTTAGWVEIEFPTYIEIGTEVTIFSLTTASPDTATFQQFDLVNNEWETLGGFSGTVSGDFPDANTGYTFTLDKPGFSNRFRLNIASVNGAAFIVINEIDFQYRRPHGFLIEETEITGHTSSPNGQKLKFRVYEDVSDFPDRALVMLGGEEWYDGVKGSLSDADPTATGRAGLLFTGWVNENQTQVHRNKDGRIEYTDFTAYDIGGWMKLIPGLPGVAQRLIDEITSPYTANENIQNYEVPYLNMDRHIWFILFMDACLLELGDYYTAGFFEKYAFPINQAQGNNIYALADGRAQTIAHRLTCNKMGQLKLLPDPQLQDEADRTTEIQAVLGPEDITKIQWSIYHYSRIGRHWGDGMIRDHDASAGDSEVSPLTIEGVVCVAPAAVVWGQGPGEHDQGEQLVITQAELNTREGHRYAARSSPDTSFVKVELTHQGDNGIDPARMSWVAMSLAAQFQRMKYVSPSNLIALWWLNEVGGSTVTDYSDTGSDGTLYNTVLNQFVGIDFEPAPRFNGTDAYIDVFSADLATAFSGVAGTASIWVKFDPAIIADSAFHFFARFHADVTNYVQFGKTTTPNELIIQYRAGGTISEVTGTISDSDWHLITLTWDANAGVSGEVKAFFDNLQFDVTQTGLGTWAGPITLAVLGAYSSSLYYHQGSMGAASIYDIALTETQIAKLATKDAVRGPDGETFANERFLVVEKTIDYKSAKMSRKVSLILEREVVGVAARTFEKPT